VHETCRKELHALLEEEPDLIARMASVAALLYARLPRVSFCGFYRVVETELLVIGPYRPRWNISSPSCSPSRSLVGGCRAGTEPCQPRNGVVKFALGTGLSDAGIALDLRILKRAIEAR
jgi:hypothetical protein